MSLVNNYKAFLPFSAEFDSPSNSDQIHAPGLVDLNNENRIDVPIGSKVHRVLERREPDYPIQVEGGDEGIVYSNVPFDLERNPQAEAYLQLSRDIVSILNHWVKRHRGAVPENALTDMVGDIQEHALRPFLRERSLGGESETFIHSAGGITHPKIKYGRFTLLSTSVPVLLNNGKKAYWPFEQAFMVFVDGRGTARKTGITPIHGHPNVVGYLATSVPRKEGKHIEPGYIVEESFDIQDDSGVSLISDFDPNKVPRKRNGDIDIDKFGLTPKGTTKLKVEVGVVTNSCVETLGNGSSQIVHPHRVYTDIDYEEATPLVSATYLGEKGLMGIFKDNQVQKA